MWTELKVPHSDYWGFTFPFSHILLACGDVGSLLPHAFEGWWIFFSPLIHVEFCVFFDVYQVAYCPVIFIVEIVAVIASIVLWVAFCLSHSDWKSGIFHSWSM